MINTKIYGIISQGSIQRFISQVHKPKDLHYRSNLMVRLILAVREILIERCPTANIILPTNNQINELSSHPNFILFTIERTDKEMLKDLKTILKENILEKVLDLGTELSQVERQQLLAISQFTITFLEGEEYTEDLYNKLLLLHNGRKLHKRFDYELEERKHKCRQCHHRIIVDQERNLCAVCNLNRVYEDTNCHPIPSLIEIVGSYWIPHKEEELQKLWKRLVDYYGQKNFNEEVKKELLYAKDYLIEKLVSLDKGKELKSSQFIKDIDEIYPEKPIYHYALIRADIDNLGNWMAGQYHTLDEDMTLPKVQNKISKAIAGFGKACDELISDQHEMGKKINGTTVYVGGDDILFFVAVPYVDIVLKEIDKLAKALNKNVAGNKEITISKSIVIAHFKTPLSSVVQLSAQSLEEVKERYKEQAPSKDGVALTYITSSRAVTKAWLENKDINSYFELIESLDSEISQSILFELKSTFYSFASTGRHRAEILDMYQLFVLEVKRIIKRKKLEPNLQKLIIEELTRLAKEQRDLSNSYYRFDVDNFFNLLHFGRLYQGEVRKERRSRDEG